MAQTSWTQSLANFFTRKAVAPSPEPHLEFARQCLEEVKLKTLPRDSKSSEFINYEQCIYLVDSLDEAVDKTSLLFERNRHPCGSSVSTEDVREITLEDLKILCMLAKKVKCFIQGCCNGHWLHAAVISTNLSHSTASLGFELKLFIVLLDSSSTSPSTLNELISVARKDSGQLVKKVSSNDEDRLVTKLRALIQYGQASSDDLELANFLRERLGRFKPNLPSLEPILHERDLTNLKHMVKIAKSGCSSVHKASWLGMDVAVKTFYGTENPDFAKEVLMLARVSHPNIVPFLCHGKVRRECFIVMELMEQDLFSLLKERLWNDSTRSSPFSAFEEFDVMLQIAEAMNYLHEMRVLHRDLKSANILVRCMKSPNAEGYEYVQVKVSDFGLSRTKEFSMTKSHLTPNTGTARWMAPELIKFPNTINILDTGMVEDKAVVENYPYKCDVYSFGMICLEILTGDVPFPNMTANEVKTAVCAGERPQLPDRCHWKLKALIKKCWNPVASSRPCFGDICTELRYLKSLHMTPLTHEPYLEFSRQCLKEVRAMTSRRASKSSEVINYEQCVYLVGGLDSAVDKASLFLEHHRHHGGSSVSTEDVRESTLEPVKILCMLAKKVKCFIEGCCNGHWLQAAVMWTNSSDFSASLGFDLNLFTVLLPPYSDSPPFPLTAGEVSTLRQVEVVLVKKMASTDKDRLVTKLRALIRYGQASSDDLELARFLLERLDKSKQSLPSIPPGSLQPVLHERDLTNLKNMVQIAKGECSVVYKASWLGMDVAVKTFYGKENPYFATEVLMLAHVSHPNIVPFLCHGKVRGECFMVMGLMEQDLFSLLKERLRNDRTRSFPFSAFEEFDVMLQIAEAMDYLHEMRVVHRGLKAGNILVRCMTSRNTEGYEYVQVKVTDFRLSRTQEASILQLPMPPTMDTARWMAPELIKIWTAKNEELVENYLFKYDVYSFGMVCLEILTGDVPFPDMTSNEVKTAVCAGERPQLPDRCHWKLKALIKKCWNPVARSRPCFGDICTELRYLKSLHMDGDFQ